MIPLSFVSDAGNGVGLGSAPNLEGQSADLKAAYYLPGLMPSIEELAVVRLHGGRFPSRVTVQTKT